MYIMPAAGEFGLGTWTPTQRFTYRLPILPSPGNRGSRGLFRLFSRCEVFASCAVASECLQQVARTNARTVTVPISITKRMIIGNGRMVDTIYFVHNESKQVDKLPPSSKYDRNPAFALADFKS